MIKHLIPIAGKHSISRVTAIVFLPQIFVKPEDVFEKLKKSSGLANYQRKNLTKLRTININEILSGVTNKEKVNGLLFEEFDDSGRLKNILRLENKTDKQSNIIFESRIYPNWKQFKERLINDLKEVNKVFPFYIEAISLGYLDEFLWVSNEDKIDVNSIFNIDSELLNKKFLDSENGTLVLLSQNKRVNVDDEEKTEISFNNRIKRITLNHQFAIKLDSVYEFDTLNKNNKLSDYYENAHNSNKTVLKEILTKEVQDLIKLK
jgi:uncharacterized protein (TIGR04255 family)